MENPELKRLPLECCHTLNDTLEGCTFWQRTFQLDKQYPRSYPEPRGAHTQHCYLSAAFPLSLYLRRSLESVRGAAEVVRTFGFTGDPGSLLEGGAE